MDNLDVTTSPFGTDSIVSSGTEFYPHVSQAQVANNTGFNYYCPRFVCPQLEECGTDNGGTKSRDVRGLILAGTYTAYAVVATAFEGTLSSGTVKLDGTVIITDNATPGGWVTGTETVIITTTGWVTANYYVATDTSLYGTLRAGAIYIRQSV
ncbi:MAG: hypothetical protein KAS32_17680 [Candidatus Peribacteraceae bacterium]|nr:hypothetical protein [Candidatus Peribacteraceae bacterium]